MSSPISRIPNLASRDVMFWLPPGGIDNGVWASAWAELADLAPSDIAPVLYLLAQADVGGYIATPGGAARPDRRVIHRLWVDSLQYHRAEDVLISYLNAQRRRSGAEECRGAEQLAAVGDIEALHEVLSHPSEREFLASLECCHRRVRPRNSRCFLPLLVASTVGLFNTPGEQRN